MLPSCAATTPIPLAVSIELPPPIATSPSQPWERYSAAPASTSSTPGLARTLSNTTGSTSDRRRDSNATSSRPAAFTPASVTSSGRRMPSWLASLPSSWMAPRRCTRRVTLRTDQSPTRLVQRLGAIQELGSEASQLGMRRPLLVTDAGVKAAGLLDVALESLRRSDVEPVVFDRVRANPGVSLVDEGAAEYRKQGCDGLVAIGGGSSMDTAKGIGVVAAHHDSQAGSIVEYEWGHSPIARRIPPMIAVPTTAGTGSEVTLWAVITDPNRKIKFNVGGTPHIASWVAVIDPELTVKLPPAVTAGTGMDALAHAVECFTMSYHQP